MMSIVSPASTNTHVSGSQCAPIQAQNEPDVPWKMDSALFAIERVKLSSNDKRALAKSFILLSYGHSGAISTVIRMVSLLDQAIPAGRSKRILRLMMVVASEISMGAEMNSTRWISLKALII